MVDCSILSTNSSSTQDISANGANYAVAVAGKFGLVYGTSASAPVVGAILTLINDARIALGKSPIGFINPAIYTNEKLRAGFKDITSGK
jgi:tripeptidyl-peptidase-1